MKTTCFILCLLFIGGCSATPVSSRNTTIELRHDQKTKYVNSFTHSDLNDLFSERSSDYEYPDDDVYYKGMYLSDPYLYGILLDKDSHYCIGLFSLDTDNGSYRKLVEYADQGYNIGICYADADYLLYWVYSLPSSEFGLYYYDLKTDKQTPVFHDPHSNEVMNIYADSDENGFMFSCYNSNNNDYNIFYTPLSSMKSELITGHSIMPVRAGNRWYFLSAEDEAYENRYLSCYDGESIVRIDTTGLQGRITSVAILDDEHLLLIDTVLTGIGHSYAYSIDLNTYTAELLFETDSMMESVNTAGRFITWDAYTPDLGVRAYLYDWKNEQYYPPDTHFIWLDESAVAYRKYKMPIEEAMNHYMLESDVSCISVRRSGNEE